MRTVALFFFVLLSACASSPLPPDWQANAKSAVDAATGMRLGQGYFTHSGERAVIGLD